MILAKNDEGEFELILGNRQLISVFLIVVILLGVFFSMGYIVGRNSAPARRRDRAQQRAKPSGRIAQKPASGSRPAASAQELPQLAAVKPNPRHPSRRSTHAAAARSGSPATGKPASSRSGETEARRPSDRPRSSALRPSRANPAAGDYWQVVATARPDAEIISRSSHQERLPRHGGARVQRRRLPRSGRPAEGRSRSGANAHQSRSGRV